MQTYEEWKKAEESDDDLSFRLGSLAPKSTGLPMVVWIEVKALGSDQTPRMRFTNTTGDSLLPDSWLPISVEKENPRILVEDYELNISDEDFEMLKKWIIHNCDTLTDYWNGEIDTVECWENIKDKYLLDDSQRSYIENVEEYGKHNIHELATVGGGKWGTRSYKAMIHGISPKDRHKPHIHIYLYDETNYENPRFNFEVSFEDIVSKDEINLLHQLDKEHNIYTSDCSWDGYEDLLEGLRDFLFAKPADKHLIGYVDNLEYAINQWNMETDFNYAEKGTNPMKQYFDEHNIHILDKFTDYFKN